MVLHNSKTVRYALLVLAVLALCLVTAAENANADTITDDVAALQALPAQAGSNFVFEPAAYYDRANETSAFSLGLGLGAFGKGLSASVFHDNTGDNTTSFAFGMSGDISDKVDWTLGVAPDFDAEGLDKIGTIGGKLTVRLERAP